jgi:hypothetical protein
LTTDNPDDLNPDEEDRNRAEESLSQQDFLTTSREKDHRNKMGNILQYSQINKRPLMENSNFSNRSEQEPFCRHQNSLDFFTSKENSRLNQGPFKKGPQ